MQAKHFPVVLYLLLVIGMGQNPGTGPTALSPNQPNTQAAQAQSQPTPAMGLASSHYQADFTPIEHHAVSWDKGHLVTFGPGEVKQPITLYDKTGKWLFDNPLTLEGATTTFVQDAVPTSEGTVAVAVAAINADGAIADLIAEVGKDGVTRAIRTSPFRASRLCTTAESRVWAYGWERNESGGDRHGHHPMLREYSFEKGQLRSDVDRATVQPLKGIPVSGSIPYDLQLKCDSRKVILLSMPTHELMEYDLSSSKLIRWPIAPLPEGFHLTGAALTDSGQVYVSALRGGPRPQALTGIFNLRASTGGTAEWVPLTIIPAEDKWFMLVGSDGEDLVYSRGLRAATVFWSATGQKEAGK